MKFKESKEFKKYKEFFLHFVPKASLRAERKESKTLLLRILLARHASCATRRMRRFQPRTSTN